jgi:integrase
MPSRSLSDLCIYDIDVNKSIDNVSTSAISERNKTLIMEFIDNCYIDRLGEHRIIKYISTLKSIAIAINVDFDKIEIQQLKKYISMLERSNKSEWTKHDYKVAICKFYKWLLNDDNPELTRWIKTNIKKKNLKSPDDMLTEQDVLLLIDNANNTRDKALIALLFDVGCRIGEAGTLRIKNLVFDDLGLVIHLNGKTGYRRVRACWCIKYINDWLSEHPGRDNSNIPLFIKFNSKPLEILKYHAIRMQIIKICKKSGISKNVHPHIFRHSRATFLAGHLTESQMNVYFGWTQGSNMAQTYVHLNGRDVDAAILRANGITLKEHT